MNADTIKRNRTCIGLCFLLCICILFIYCIYIIYNIIKNKKKNPPTGLHIHRRKNGCTPKVAGCVFRKNRLYSMLWIGFWAQPATCNLQPWLRFSYKDYKVNGGKVGRKKAASTLSNRRKKNTKKLSNCSKKVVWFAMLQRFQTMELVLFSE